MKSSAANQALAIIVPAYKGDFLAKALATLTQQTDQRFNLYVCDDASLDKIEAITRAALGSRPYVFKRFEKNLGGTALARHWDRCVALTGEPWVWVFSDDDLLDDNCVAAFHELIAAEPNAADVLRFDAWIIDAADKIIGLHALSRDRETWLEFAYGLLMGWRRSFMQQIIFRRTAYDRAGGFLDQPLGWSTDDAVFIGFGREKPIRRIPGARLRWRSSDKNISPDRSLERRKKTIVAVCQFLQWLQGQLQSPREVLFPGDDLAFRQAMDRYLIEQVMVQGGRPALANLELLKRTRAALGVGSGAALMKHIAAATTSDAFASAGNVAKKLARRRD